MSLGYNTYYAMPRLDSYEAAAAHEAAVKPIRGDDEGRKPLGRRDQKYRRIKREGDGSIIIFDDWRGDAGDNWFIRFAPNGELHIYDMCWSNKATHNEVISRVTGMHVFTEAGRMWVHFDGGIAPIASRVKSRWVGDKYVKNGKDPEPSIFVKNERGNWVCKNVAGITTHVVNRKGANAVRKRYASGLAYIKALTQLRRDDAPKHEELVAAFRDTRLKGEDLKTLGYYWNTRHRIPPVGRYDFMHQHAADLAALIASDDPSDQYKAFLWLGCETERTPTVIAKHVDKVLAMHHHDEWLKAVEHPAGKKAIDRYKWAFPVQAQTP